MDNSAIELHNIRMWVARDSEKLVAEYGRQFPVVYVSGARQVGKTSLLARMFPDYSYVTLDDPAMAADAENAPSHFLSSLSCPAIIDEAQYAPGLFRHIKMAVDSTRKNGQFLITGSQNFNLMSNLSESLAGRCGIINLQPLSAGELARSGRLTSVEEYIVSGGYPALHSDPAINREYWFPSYIATYLERDVRNIINVGSLRDFSRFLRAAAARTAQILSLADLSRDVGVSPNTVKSWISVLQASRIIQILEPYHRNLGKRLAKSPKLYFLDTGLAAHLAGLRTWDEAARSPMAGALWETYVFNQLLAALLSAGETSPPLYFWRTKDGHEIDFLLERGGRFVAVEAKLTETPGLDSLKGFGALKDYYGSDSLIKGIVACRVRSDYALADGITAGNVISPDIF
ncbi:MAG: ATP-binding protein [Nitrospirae bacterium]|nr:ATP-binding protein [Nitrospirota bacterium]